MNLNISTADLNAIHEAASRCIDEYNTLHKSRPTSTFMCNVIRVRDVEELIQYHICNERFALVAHLEDVVKSQGTENTKEHILFVVASNFWNDFVENKHLWSDERILKEYERLL